MEEARAALMESLETKADAREGEGLDEGAARQAEEAAMQAVEVARASAKQALDAAMESFTQNPAARAAGIEKCRSELRLAEEAERAAPERAEELEAQAKFGSVEGLAVKNVGVVWYGIAKRQMPYPFRKLHVDDVLSSLP